MKPETLQDLLKSGGCSLGEIRNIAKSLFTSQTTGAGPEGYVVTFPDFDDLPAHVQDFIIKAVSLSKIENVLDAAEEDGTEPEWHDDDKPDI